MPHQCVRCGSFYDDTAKEILNGCPCGGKFFFYIKKTKLADMKKYIDDSKITHKDRIQIEKDIAEMIGTKTEEDDIPVVLDIESVNIIQPGKYVIDIMRLFKKEPVVFKIEEGKYIIDLTHGFKPRK